MEKKTARTLWIVVIVLLTAMTLIYVSHTVPEKKASPPPSAPGNKYGFARVRQRISDFKYTTHIGSRKTLSIECRHLSLHKRKIGPVRFGLMRELKLETALIKFYRYSGVAARSIPSGRTSNNSPAINPIRQSASHQDKSGQYGMEDSFGRMVAENKLLPHGLKKLSYIFIRRGTLEFYLDGKIESRISADKIKMNILKKKVSLISNVKVESQNRKLTLDRLELNPENMQLKGGAYILETPDGRRSGKKIITDYTLRNIH
ncbi:hypothetical protein [Desulfobacter latus]|uniref:Uncharacterized protein n=1 Tax=Desulfobacter latus TaxID=2292 RepID=A0A850T866_9BACT|nr:hypothetical protein [Desulfobacter latus]NWH05652.1 hypothetical protein [Desulfobacter latus]